MLDVEKEIRNAIRDMFDWPITDSVVSSNLTNLLTSLEQMGYSPAICRHVITNMIEEGSLELVKSVKE